MYSKHLPADLLLLKPLRFLLIISLGFLLYGWNFKQDFMIQIGFWILIFLPILRVIALTVNLILNKEKEMGWVGLSVLML
nr:DUF1634 domain-containing protein [Pseudobdellovibrionaceae bacterium]